MIHVITLSWNGEEKLNALAPKLFDNLRESGEEWHWYIKDNGSKDNTTSMFEDRGDVTIFDYGHNRDNFAKGMNWLAEKAQPNDGDLILLLNNDVVFNEDLAIKKMVDLQKNSGCDIVGARLFYTDTTKLQHAGVIFSQKYNMMPFHYRHKDEVDEPTSKNRYFQAVTAAVCLVSAKAFKEVNGFHEGYNWSFEDIDLCLKIGQRKKDNVIYCGNTNIFHEESASLAKNPVNKMFVGPNVSLFKSQWEGKYMEDLDYYLKAPNYRVYEG